MTWSFKAWRRNRVLRRARLPLGLWQAVIARHPVFRGLSREELERLRQLAVLFLHEKQITAAGGAAVGEELRLAVAAQACLPILNLGLDWYRGWVSVIVYPAAFVPRHEHTDEAGVVHVTRRPLSGESWLRGPVVLSAADVEWSGGGFNVVIHEFAHKLDMINGAADGFPPLHRGMNAATWSAVFSESYRDFCGKVEAGIDGGLDPYAAESPGEFFAVLSEAFFEIPLVLRGAYSAVYSQLAAFYRQDPAARTPWGAGQRPGG